MCPAITHQSTSQDCSLARARASTALTSATRKTLVAFPSSAASGTSVGVCRAFEKRRLTLCRILASAATGAVLASKLPAQSVLPVYQGDTTCSASPVSVCPVLLIPLPLGRDTLAAMHARVASTLLVHWGRHSACKDYLRNQLRTASCHRGVSGRPALCRAVAEHDSGARLCWKSHAEAGHRARTRLSCTSLVTVTRPHAVRQLQLRPPAPVPAQSGRNAAVHQLCAWAAC